jgi:hypothetical protein
MAVAVIIDFPDGNAQKYEQVTGKLFPEGKLPEGWPRRSGSRSP